MTAEDLRQFADTITTSVGPILVAVFVAIVVIAIVARLLVRR